MSDHPEAIKTLAAKFMAFRAEEQRKYSEAMEVMLAQMGIMDVHGPYDGDYIIDDGIDEL